MTVHFPKLTRRPVLLFLVLIVSGCATYAGFNLDQMYGKPAPQTRILPAETSLAQRYLNEVKPLVENRCVVCHACYDAPCQLKMSSAEGIDRGSNKEKVYQGTRLVAANTTRMFVDAHSTEEWRKKGFSPVLNERVQSSEANTQLSVISRMLMLKQNHPLPDEKVLSGNWDFSLDRNEQCPTIEEMSAYEQSYPLWGMPYGLTQLPDHENQILMDWVAAGAPMTSQSEIPQAVKPQIAEWERFLNGDDFKHQLTARYLFEHWFVSHLYFPEAEPASDQTAFFRIVRSRTAPGKPVDIIATRRPFDDPGVQRVYYRILPVRETIVDKTHMPFALTGERMARLKAHFIEPGYTVSALPGYTPELAANPLLAFEQLPVGARYRYMIDNAQHTIMGFIKGPVCRGQLALNVINDRFWVVFVDPDIADSPQVAAFYATQADNLRLPAEKNSTTLPLHNWVTYSKQQGRFLRAKNAYLNDAFKNGQHLTTDLIWDGDGTNDNAALTIFRHFDSATVVKGLVGEQPKTAWVLDYSLIERIHYLLVAGFDVYGNFGHQLLTRMYMDFLRMEGESNFLSLLPPATRRSELANWYQDANQSLLHYLEGDINDFSQPSGIEYKTSNPKAELLGMLQSKLKGVDQNHTRYALDNVQLNKESISQLHALARIQGRQATLFPELTFIMIEPTDTNVPPQLLTLVRNSAHKNISSLFDEEKNRLPSNDNLTLVNGLLGSYPSAFWHIREADLPDIVSQAKRIYSEEDYRALLDHVAVRRTNPDFWPFSDKLNQIYRQSRPIESGLLDYNRLENR
ncbi:fatty acid cis/trans isomerase [Photobacterium halotolerans]|uniref:9-hexadecenoic acid cis-trans isomerase n=1 Tax=Photobacterium halotolerans TaxID=265726 RepID=A0A0F5VB92_9GAMM|nr:fatty acid cis/trans isomerase [Photobacterium halotolerans]KKC99393.1 9-hexadecenoic acid cis-trans isomerase [Photobacterium halotolerans]